MSHFASFVTQMSNKNRLLKALDDLGYGKEAVEVHEQPQTLMDYCGLPTPETATIIIRRNRVGSYCNDVGFTLVDGNYRAIICDFAERQDRAGMNEAWRGKLAQRYAYHTTVETLSEQGYELAEETNENGTIKLVLNSYSLG